MLDNGDLAKPLIEFIRAFGLLQPDRTPCGLEVHITDAHAMAEIEANAPLTQQQLAVRLGLRKSTVSRLVGQLIVRGWVSRSAHPIDRRAQLLALTTEGRDVAGRIGRSRAQRLDALLLALPEGERQAVVRSIGLLAHAARASSRDAVMS